MQTKWIVLAGAVLAPVSGHTQDSRAPLGPIPHISAAAQHEVKVSPDRATVQISVQTRGATAAAAGAQNATRLQAVLSALRTLGLTNDQLSTVNYNIHPDYRHVQNKEPEIIGYNVTNTIVADVRQLSQVGPVIDAALRAGANMMSSLQFYASNTEAARRTAIAAAIAKARGDAEAAARAAGGSLGALLDITIGSFPNQPPRPMVMMRGSVAEMDASTPIQPGEQTLSVMVSTRWRFNPAQ
ncbi:MAG: SIMPL domain-containing protein [Gemmatimonadaceae bacterium]